MSAKKYDDVAIFFDKSRQRYGAKVTIEKGKPRKTVHGKTEEEVLLKARQLMYSTRDEKFMEKKGIPLVDLLKMNFEQCVIAKEGITTLLAKDQLEGQEKENAEKLLVDLYTSMQLIEDRHTILDILINENNKELNN